MRCKCSFLLVLLFFLIRSLQAQPQINYVSNAEQTLVENYENSEQKNLSSFKQFLLSTNFSKSDTFFENHLSALKDKIRDKDSHKKKTETIFKYLHENVLLQYNLNALVPDLTENQIYNCVTATSIFVSIVEEFGIPYNIYETPAHVYASINHRNEEIVVELTNPKKGFDFKSDKESLIQTLIDSKLISRDELAEKGAEQLYRENIAKTKSITKKQLLAIQYHNEALIKASNNQYAEAYNQMNKAVKLYPNQTFSEAYKYIVTVSQLDFTLDVSEKHTLLNSLSLSTKNDSMLTYTLVNHLGELVEDLLKLEENFESVTELLAQVESNILQDSFIDKKLRDYYVYMYTVFAQNASLKGETLIAKSNIEKALILSPDNSTLNTYYVSVTSNYATKLSQSGFFDAAQSIIETLASKYPEGYPIIDESRVQIILNALMPIPITYENEERLRQELNLAYSIQPENIYLKSFSATIFHELAMQQVRRSNYQKAKDLILDGLKFNSTDPTLLSDLKLIEDILK